MLDSNRESVIPMLRLKLWDSIGNDRCFHYPVSEVM